MSETNLHVYSVGGLGLPTEEGSFVSLNGLNNGSIFVRRS